MILRKGDTGALVEKLQRSLYTLGIYLGGIDSVFGEWTEDAVVDFQVNHGLLGDGVAGPLTIKALNDELARKFGLKDPRYLSNAIIETPARSGLFSKMPPLKTRSVQADQYKDGFVSFVLREDVAQRYLNVRNEVLTLGGIIPSAGGLRALSEPGGPSRSQTSFHYTGRALDMALSAGMQNPKTDPLVITAEAGNRWRVWCRTKNENVPVTNLNGYVHNHTIVNVSDRFFDMTSIWNRHGFRNISARKAFFSQRLYTSAEWWHFQDETGLTTGIDTFGSEILKIYTADQAKKFANWNIVKDYRFGIEWR